MTDAAPLFTAPSYVAHGFPSVMLRHCVHGVLATADAPCYGQVSEEVPHACEGHLVFALSGHGRYIHEHEQEGGDLIDTAAEAAAGEATVAVPGQETFLNPQDELRVLREKLAAVTADCAAHVAARQVSARALNKMASEAASWKQDALMWSGAWERELSGYYWQKSHRIDAAVVSTQRLVARMRAAEGALAELVATTDMQEKTGKTPEYEKRRDSAWADAREVLKGRSGPRIWVASKMDGFWLNIESGNQASINLGMRSERSLVNDLLRKVCGHPKPDAVEDGTLSDAPCDKCHLQTLWVTKIGANDYRHHCRTCGHSFCVGTEA